MKIFRLRWIVGGLGFVAVWSAACSSSPTLSSNLAGTESGHREGIQRIVILGTNDIHGALFPMQLKTKEPDPAQMVSYTSGGAVLLSSYIHQLRAQYGPHMIWLDGGDEFQGTLESNTSRGQSLVDFFNKAGLNAAAIGNHEFDFGPETAGSDDRLGAIKARMREAKYTYVASNVVEKSTGKLPTGFEHTVTRLMIPVEETKVGVIGLSTEDTPSTTRPEFVKDLAFTHLKEATLRESAALREEGADVVVIVAHAGLMCELGRGAKGYALRRPGEPQGECREQDEIVKLLKSIPSGTVDAVVSGHTHQVIHHWVAGVPVIQGGARGHYFNLIHLNYDKVQKKILTEETVIEGPIPVCEKVFANQGDCNGDRSAPAQGRGPLVQNTFRGQDVQVDQTMAQYFAPVLERTAKVRNEVLGKAEKNIDPDRYRESALGNLVTDAMREATGADFALVNPGGLREALPSGTILFDHLYKALPFDNSAWVIDITGKELKLLLRVVESGWKGYFPTSGLKLKLISADSDAPVNDLNRNGRIDPWEVDRLKDVKMADGTKIKDQKIYRLAIVDFLAIGGDELGWVMEQIPQSRFHFDHAPLLRDVVKKRILEQSPLNTASRPLVDPHQPRVVFEKASTSTRRRKK